jgi:predicted transcriptional regulator
MDVIKEYLENIGLNTKEQKVYRNMLGKGSVTIMDISRITKISRTTLYPFVESLVEKGFLLPVMVGKKTLYRAMAPSRITEYLQEKMNKTRSLLDKSEEIITEINAENKQKSEKATNIVVRPGRQGVLDSLKQYDSLKSDEIKLELLPLDKLSGLFTSKEKKKYFNIKDSDNTGLLVRLGENTYVLEKSDARFIRSMIRIYSGGVAWYTLEDSLEAIEIESSDIARTVAEILLTIVSNEDS